MAKRRRVQPDDGPLVSNPFAHLSGKSLSDAPLPSDAPPPGGTRAEPIEVETREPAMPKRLVVRRLKKGQGGKTVTVVEGLAQAATPTLLSRVKRELGCAGRIEGDALIAGTADHTRVAHWFENLGCEKVVLGN